MTEERESRYGERDLLGRLGKALVGQLFILFKTAANYPVGHTALDAPVANFLKVVREISIRNEEVAVKVKGGNFYLGDLRLKADSASYQAGKFLMEEMARHQVGGITFSPAVTSEELSRFVHIFRDEAVLGSSDSYAAILELMQQRVILHVEVEARFEEAETVQVDKERRIDRLRSGKLSAKLLFKKAFAALDEALDLAGAGQTMRLRGPKRVVQHLIDLLPDNESTLLGMVAASNQEPRAGAGIQQHSVNVCVLCLVMGRRLGMSKFHLCELGMAALLHDIGKADVPGSVLEKRGGLSAQEQQALEAHPVYGVKKMMKFKGLDVMSSRIITGVVEHHLLADFSGYPRFRYNRLSLFGRIISIADCYDEVTSRQPDGGTTYQPDKALRFMLSRGGKAFDQGLLKLFINCVGVHSIGSVLLLDSKELAVVVENDPARPDNPRIRIIADSLGREVDSEIEELTPPGAPRSIVSVVDPSPFRIDIGRYFV